MRFALAVMIILILFGTTYALKFDENIRIYGKGEMFAYTKSDEMGDSLGGIGNQNYTRNLSSEEGNAKLISDYDYTKDRDRELNNSNNLVKSNRSNMYRAFLNSEGGLRHSIVVYSNISIESKSKIERSGDDASTDYSITSNDGNLSESVTDLRSGRVVSLIGTQISGTFGLNSSLNDKVEIEREYLTAADLLARMERVELTGEKPPAREIELSGNDPVLVMGKKKTPEDAAFILNEHGISLYSAGDYENAIKAYNDALDLAPKVHIWINKAEAHSKLGSKLEESGNERMAIRQYEEANKAFDEAIKLNPDDLPDVLNRKSINLIRLKKFAESIRTSDKIIQMDSENKNAFYLKGLALLGLGKQKDALEAFDVAIELDQDFDQALYQKGKLLYIEGNYSMAKEVFNVYIDTNPDDADAWNFLGKSNQKLRLYNDSEVAYEKAVERNPELADAWYALIEVYEILGKKDKADAAKEKVKMIGIR